MFELTNETRTKLGIPTIKEHYTKRIITSEAYQGIIYFDGSVVVKCIVNFIRTNGGNVYYECEYHHETLENKKYIKPLRNGKAKFLNMSSLLTTRPKNISVWFPFTDYIYDKDRLKFQYIHGINEFFTPENPGFNTERYIEEYLEIRDFEGLETFITDFIKRNEKTFNLKIPLEDQPHSVIHCWKAMMFR